MEKITRSEQRAQTERSHAIRKLLMKAVIIFMSMHLLMMIIMQQYVWVAIQIVLISLSIYLYQRTIVDMMGITIAMDLVDEQCDLISKSDLMQHIEEFSLTDQQRYKYYIELIGARTGGVYRKGHLIWLLQLLESDNPRSLIQNIPTFEPSPEEPYRIASECGALYFREYIEVMKRHHQEPDPAEAQNLLNIAIAQIIDGVKVGNMPCSLVYANKLMLGLITDTQGLCPDPEAEIFRIYQRTQGRLASREYVDILLSKKEQPDQVQKALQIMHQLMPTQAVVRVELAKIYLYGLHNQPIDTKKAKAILLPEFSKTRTLLDMVGIDQTGYLQRAIRYLEQQADSYVYTKLSKNPHEVIL